MLGATPFWSCSFPQWKLASKESGPNGPGFRLPAQGFTYSFPLAAVHWSDEALQNIKFQAPNLKVSGVREEK
jgi:hypothetical protein